jgi:hypothetical protein
VKSRSTHYDCRLVLWGLDWLGVLPISSGRDVHEKLLIVARLCNLTTLDTNGAASNQLVVQVTQSSLALVTARRTVRAPTRRRYQQVHDVFE